ncbi:hypothetical protein [Pseudoxanthomonas suwonensis]
MSARLRGCIGGALLAAATAAAAWLNVDHGSARLVLEPGRVGACTTPAATAVEWDAGKAGEEACGWRSTTSASRPSCGCWRARAAAPRPGPGRTTATQ